jgi:ferritin
MLGAALHDALNEQIRHEFYSAYLYLAMAAYFDGVNLPGFAHWMRKQSEEEQQHALKFFDYVSNRGGRPRLQAIEAPPAEFGSPLGAMQQTLAHEQRVTAMIHRLYQQAIEERDFPTQTFLHWFIDEQVEEEKTVGDIVALLQMVGEHGAALLILVHRLGQRA